MSADGHHPRCEALTKTGERCRLPAQPDSHFCHVHHEQGMLAAQEIEAEAVAIATTIETAKAALPAKNESTTVPERNGRDAAPDEETRRRQVRDELQQLAQATPSTLADEAESRLPAARQQVVETLHSSLSRLAARLPVTLPDGLQEQLSSEWLDAETWKGIAYVLQVTLQMQAEFLERRLRGDYTVDEWGYDQEIADYFALVAGLLYNKYWRVEMTGLDHIPASGRTLLVANHSGVLPMDGAMISFGIREHHPAHRLARTLVANWFPTLPFLSTLLNKTGQILAHPDNGRRLLEADELVLVFPEGYKGVGKLYKDRYKLARFGRGGFVKTAVEACAPIIPVAVVGAEETYPMMTNAKPIARLLGFPFFPLTPTFPWLGPLGVLPLPSKWYIDIGQPIDAHLRDPELIHNPVFTSDVADLVRNQVQDMIDKRLAARKSIFFG